MSAPVQVPPAAADPLAALTTDQLLNEVVPDPNWQNAPNSHLGGRSPRAAIGTRYESTLRDMLLGAAYGMFS